MATPTVDEVVRRVGARYGADETFSRQPVLRALVMALATVLVGREDDAALAGEVSPILEVLLPTRFKRATWVHLVAEEMARRMLAAESPTGSVLDCLGGAATRVRLPEGADLDGIVRELRGFLPPGP